MGTLHEVTNAGLVKFKQNGTEQFVYEKGTSFPVSPAPVDGQVFYRTDTDTLYIYDGSTWDAVAGSGGSLLRVYVETPNETPNDVITVFTVDNAYIAGTTEVSRNGLRLVLGSDYTESNPAIGQITLAVAPSTGADILVSYNRVNGSESPRLVTVSYTTGTPSGTYSGSTTVFDLPFTYTAGTGNLLVFSGGVLMTVGASNDYLETDSDTVTFNSARTGGERISFLKLGISNDLGTPGGWIDDGSTLRLETSTDSVGIGTASPLYKTHILVNNSSTDPILAVEQTGSGDSKMSFTSPSGTGVVGWYAGGTSFTMAAPGFSAQLRLGTNARLDSTSTVLLVPSSSTQSTFSFSASGSGSFLTPVNTVDSGGSLGANIITTTSASYTALSTDYTILADATSGAITVNLPSASGCTRRIYVIKKTDSSVNTVTVDANGSQTIDGALTYVLTTQYESVTIQSNGSNWFVL